jgi:hypothetical protein
MYNKMRPPAKSLRIVWFSYGLKLDSAALKHEFEVAKVQNFNLYSAIGR